MADMFATGATWLAGQRDSFAARSVTYSRGAAAIAILAMPTAVSQQVNAEDGSLVVWEGRDYVVSYFGFEPLPGDLITDGAENFAVLIPPNADDVFKWLDGSRTSIRIHTKRVP